MYTKISTYFFIFLLLGLGFCYYYQVNISSQCYFCSDYAKFYQSAKFASEDKSIYSKIVVSTAHSTKELTPTLNTPFFTLLILPLSHLSYKTSLWLWSILSITAGAFSIFLLYANRTYTGMTNSVSLLGSLAAFFTYFPTFATIHYGQISLFLFLITTDAWLAAHRKKMATAGILLGIATSLKLFFGLFILYFLMRREWRSLCWFIVTLLLCILLPLLLWKPSIYVEYYHILSSIHWYASSWNASLYGLLLRLLGGESNASLLTYPLLTHSIFLLTTVLILVGFIFILKPTPKLDDKYKLNFDFSLTLVTMLIISPLSWLYYFVLLIIPIIFLLQHQNLPLLFPTCLSIMLSGIPHLLVPASHITLENVLVIFALSSCYVLSLFILWGELFYIRYRSSSNQNCFENSTLMLFYTAALTPSFLTLLWIINQELIC